MSGSGPMYLQIAESVRDSVVRGQYRPGQMLPPERVYMEKFSVSRVTVRRALRELVDEALIESRQGSGYVVQSSRLFQSLENITSFSEDCRSRGLVPGSVLLGRRSGRSDAEESAHFDVPVGTEVLRVRRVRTGGGEPLLLEHATLLGERAPRLALARGQSVPGDGRGTATCRRGSDSATCPCSPTPPRPPGSTSSRASR